MDHAEPVSRMPNICLPVSEMFIARSRKFLAEYYQGTKSFIDEYWEMIHRAAGWAALRAWLLVSANIQHSGCRF